MNLNHRSSSTKSNAGKADGGSTESGDNDSSQLSAADADTKSYAATNFGSSFWPLIRPLYNALNFVAQIYAHNGMFLETNHYLQEGYKLATAAGSESYSSQSATLLGSSYLKAGMLDNGRKYLNLIRQTNNNQEDHQSREDAFLSYHSGVMHGILGDHDTALAAYDASESMLVTLTDSKRASTLDKISSECASLEAAMSKLSLSTTKPSTSRKATSRTKPSTAKQPTSRAKSSATIKRPVTEHCPLLIADREMVLHQKARALISLKQSSAALKVLQAIDSSAGSQSRMIDHKFTLAKQIFQECVEKMAIDADYSALQESTLSFPAALRSEKAADRLSLLAASSPRKPTKTGRNQGRSKSPVTNGFFENLTRAQECLLEIHSIAFSVSSTAVIHDIASLLNSIAILLSAFGHLKAKLPAYPNSGSCSVGKSVLIISRRR
jgi:separase